MRAGASAGQEAQRQQLLAVAHDRAAAAARARSSRFGIAERTEANTARVLSPLAALGHVLLPDRRWPGTRRANVDLLLVGPGGVLIIDTKAWADVKATPENPVLNRFGSSNPRAWLWQEAHETVLLTLRFLS